MSYDFAFWREIAPVDATPAEICSRLYEDEDIDGLAELPLELIKDRLLIAFPTIHVGATGLDWEGSDSYFQITWPPSPVNAILVSCGHSLLKSPDVINRLIDIMREFGCALYDPQIDTRFEQPD